MWDEGRDIDDLLTQISAVRAALDQIGRAMLELHIDQSLRQAIQQGDASEAARDLKNALDRFIS
jgi:DNA-binding FrmR family transcriptional regulator